MTELDCSQIKGIIFDVDGTILDSMPIWDDMCSRYLLSLGVQPREDLNETVLNMTIDEGVHYVKVTYQLSQSEAELKDGLLDLIRHFYYEEAEFKPGVKALIEGFAARNIPMIIVTSGDQDLAGHALTRLGVMKHFLKILTSNDLNTNKEEPYIFYRAAAELIGRNVGNNIDCAVSATLEEKDHESVVSKMSDTKANVSGENAVSSCDSTVQTKIYPCNLTQEDIDFFTAENSILSKIYVIEDSVFATKTAKKAGFGTIAVEDDASRIYWDELKNTADIYLHSLEELQLIGVDV